jgi:hypothetical protein
MQRTAHPALTAAFLLVGAVSACRAESDSVRTCEFEVKSRCASGEVHATFDASELTKLAITVFWCGLPGKPGYSCVVDYSRKDGDSDWAESAGTVTIDKKSPWNPSQPDRIKVTVGKHVSIDLEEAQSAGSCGAGAELPRAIVIPEGKGTCRVWLDAP